MLLPTLAITIGDVAGIGPEVAVRAMLDDRVRGCCRPLAVGHPAVVERAVKVTMQDAGVDLIRGPDELHCVTADAIACWNPAGEKAPYVSPGRLDARAGRAAFDCVTAAAQAALEGRVDGVTTAPLNKAALRLAGLNYPGHTEILAKLSGVQKFAMMLYLPTGAAVRSPHGLGVAHVTLHTSLRSVPGLLSAAAVTEKIQLTHAFLQDVGCREPRVGVCALNPHAGEEGLFGDEEQRIIAPGVREACLGGFDAAGPFPADTLLRRGAGGEFDGIVAMYHDQGHIAIKLMGFDNAVNVTWGLPIVRTSPSHGTAFDIAWTGRASAEGMIEAIRIAALLARGRASDDRK